MTGIRTFAGSDPRVELCSPWSQRNGGYDALRSSLGQILANGTHELHQQRGNVTRSLLRFSRTAIRLPNSPGGRSLS